jgi:ferritin-like metal-binding protein YciE
VPFTACLRETPPFRVGGDGQAVAPFPTGRGANDRRRPEMEECGMKLDSLQDLFIAELQDLYDAEKRLVKALPGMAKKSSNAELQNAIREHLEQTRNQVTRLEDVFEGLGLKAKGQKCKGMTGIIEEGEDMAEKDGEPAAIDAGIIASAQRVEHYEIAGYGSVCSYAETLGHTRAHQLLSETLQEEKEADRKLTALAEQIVNVEAAASGAGGAAEFEA